MIFSVPVPSSKAVIQFLTLVTNWAMWDENIVVSVNGADVLYAQANSPDTHTVNVKIGDIIECGCESGMAVAVVKTYRGLSDVTVNEDRIRGTAGRDPYIEYGEP